MTNWMPSAMDPQALQAAFGRPQRAVSPEVPQNFAESGYENPMTPYVNMWQKFREGAPDYMDEWKKYQNLPERYFESAGAANPGWQQYLRIMRGPTAT
jgi:hypothetical protein